LSDVFSGVRAGDILLVGEVLCAWGDGPAAAVRMDAEAAGGAGVCARDAAVVRRAAGRDARDPADLAGAALAAGGREVSGRNGADRRRAVVDAGVATDDRHDGQSR